MCHIIFHTKRRRYSIQKYKKLVYNLAPRSDHIQIMYRQIIVSVT